MRAIPLAFLGLLVLASGFAAAQDDPHREGVTAQASDEPLPDPLVLGRDELAARFPTVARALENLGVHTPHLDGERDSLRAFFEEHNGRGVRVDGQDFTVMSTMPATVPSTDDDGDPIAYGDGIADSGPTDPDDLDEGSAGERGNANALGAVATMAVAMGLLLLVGRRRP